MTTETTLSALDGLIKPSDAKLISENPKTVTFQEDVTYYSPSSTDMLKPVKHWFLNSRNKYMATIPLLFVLVITILYPGLYFPLLYDLNGNVPIDRLLHHSTINNFTFCHTQYEIKDRLRISLCGVQEITVDLREFINEKPTLKGIQFSKDEWLNFMTHVALIDNVTRNGPMSVPSHPNNEQILNIKENNLTSCHTQFRVLDRLRATVCGDHKEVKVDLREFTDEKPTIIGVQLSFFEWQDFMTYIGLVDFTVRNGSKI